MSGHGNAVRGDTSRSDDRPSGEIEFRDSLGNIRTLSKNSPDELWDAALRAMFFYWNGKAYPRVEFEQMLEKQFGLESPNDDLKKAG